MREKEPATRIVFVRHGMTDFPKDRIYCDEREDPPLNETGRHQAQTAAELLRGRAVDVIYTSPMARTRGTAEAVRRTLGVPLAVEQDLRERGFGIWDGLYFRRYPAAISPGLYQVEAGPRRLQARAGGIGV